MAAGNQGPRGVSRRGFVKGTVVAGMVALGASVVATLKPILAPRIGTIVGEVIDGFVYTQPSVVGTVWFQQFLGQEAAPSDFSQVGQAATTLWRPLKDTQGRIIPGTGAAALVMKVDKASPPDTGSRILLPGDLTEKVTMGGFVAAFNTCVHLCCNPGVHFVNPGGTILAVPPPAEDVLTHPDYTLSGLPVVAPDIGVIYCPCHHSQYDPFRLVWANHPTGQRYLGANWVWGPARRALPVIPVEVTASTIRGLNTHPEWYRGYCGL